MSKPTILCVDDEHNVLLTLRTQLLRHFPHYAIEIAESGDEALMLVDELLAEGVDVPLVIADQIMPGMKGDELLIELHTRHPHILKVMLTGQARAEDMGNVVNRGKLYRFIAKPWHESELNLVVTEALRRYGQEQQLLKQVTQEKELILVVDDTPANLEAISEALANAGYEVAIATLGERAIKQAQRSLPDLILLDIIMPEIDGFEICRRLKADPVTRDIPVIFMTALSDEVNKVTGLNLGAIDYITKPFQVAEVIARVRVHLRSRHLTKMLEYQNQQLQQEIVDRKLAEAALRTSEERYRFLSDVSPVGIYRNDTTGKCTYANEKTAEITGLSLTEIIGDGWASSIHPEDRLQVYANWQSFVESVHRGQPADYRLELRFLHADGSIVWGLTQAIPERNAHGEVVGFIGSVTDISDRKQAEIALRESEYRYATLAEASPVGIFRNSATGSMIYANDRWCEITGLTREAGLGDGWLACVHPDWRDRLFNEWEYIIQDGSHHYTESCLQMPDGSLKWVYCQAQAEKDAQGNITGYVGTLTDITDQKLLEISLRQREAQLRSFVEHTPLGVAMFDRQMNYLVASQRWIADYRLEGQSIIGKCHYDVFPNVSDKWRQVHQRGLSGIVERCEQESYIRADGQQQWVRWEVRPWYDAADMIGGIIIFGEVITDRIRTELALRDSERRYATLTEVAPVGIFRFDAQGECVYVNSRWCEMTGRSVDAAFGNAWIQTLHPEDRDRIPAEWTQALEQGGFYRGEGRYLRPDGSIVWFYCQVLPETESNGMITGYVGTVTDLSDRKQAEEAAQIREQQVISLLNNIPHIAWLKDCEGRFLAVNEPFAQACGHTTTHLVGLTDLDIWTLELAETYRRDDFEVIASERQKRVEERLITAEGVEQWIETIKTPIFNPHGVVVGTTGIAMNITERKRSEQILQQLNQELEQRVQQRTQELQQQTQLLQTILNSMGDGVLVANTSGEILLHNPAAEQMSGLGIAVSQAEQQHHLWGIYLVDGSPCSADQMPLMRAMQGESIDQAELILRNTFHPEGIYVEATARPLYDSHHRLIGGVAVLRDVSDRKRAEQKLQSESLRLQLALEAAEMGTWEATLESGIWSERTEAIFGYALGTFPGDRDTFLKLIHPDDQERVFQALTHSFATQAPYKVDYRINRLDGELRWVSVRGKVVPMEEGAGLRIVGVALDITDRKQAEESIRFSQEQLQLALEGSGDGLWDWNIESGEAYLSPRWLGMLGYEVGELPGHVDTWEQLIHPDDRPGLMQVLNDHLQDNLVPYQVEYRAQTKTGDWRWIANYGKVVTRDAAGKPLRMVGLQRDITERKQAEISLRDNEARLRLALMAAKQGLYDLDLTTGDAIVSPEYAIMLGYDPAEFQETNAKWIERLHPDDREPVANVYRAYVAGEISDYKVEFRQRMKNGDWKWILSLGKIVAWDEEGQPLRMLGTHTDMSDRKRTELALQESEMRFRQIAETINEVFWLADPTTGEMLYLNPAFESVWGQPRSKLYANGMAWLEDVYPDDRESIRSLLPRQELEDLEFEYRIVRPDGEVRWIRDRSSPIYDELGNVYRIAGISEDVTERKQAEEFLLQVNAELEKRVEERTLELKEAKEAAETANRAKSSFLANMSHELRTPLNAILGFSQLLNRSPILDLEQQKQISIINRSGEHLLNLINDILEMSKIEAGRIMLTTKIFDLQHLLKSLEDLFRLKAESKGLHLIVQSDAIVPRYIKTDESKLRQVLINLLSNAIKFTQTGNVTLQVRVEERESGRVEEGESSVISSSPHPFIPSSRYLSVPPSPHPLIVPPSIFLCFAVTDTGPGIDPIEQEALFEPFVQAKAGQKSQEGTGLGLPISRQFVQLMGGELTVHSIPGQGATFSFEIPIEHLQTGNLPVQFSIQQVIGLAPDQPRYRLLVVEDHPENRQFLVQLLQNIGFEVREAENGQEAVALWQQWMPHLIWMDMRMPVMDGYEATRRIRALEAEQTPDSTSSLHLDHSITKILALTASAFEDERIAILASGCDDFVLKPVTETLLFEKMAEHIGVRYVYQEQIKPSEPDNNLETSEQALSNALQSMSSEWIEQLQRAARMADEELIFQLLDQIPTAQTLLANSLKELVNELRLDTLIELINVNSR